MPNGRAQRTRTVRRHRLRSGMWSRGAVERDRLVTSAAPDSPCLRNAATAAPGEKVASLESADESVRAYDEDEIVHTVPCSVMATRQRVRLCLCGCLSASIVLVVHSCSTGTQGRHTSYAALSSFLRVSSTSSVLPWLSARRSRHVSGRAGILHNEAWDLRAHGRWRSRSCARFINPPRNVAPRPRARAAGGAHGAQDRSGPRASSLTSRAAGPTTRRRRQARDGEHHRSAAALLARAGEGRRRWRRTSRPLAGLWRDAHASSGSSWTTGSLLGPASTKC